MSRIPKQNTDFPVVQYRAAFRPAQQTNLKTLDETAVIITTDNNIASSPFCNAASALASAIKQHIPVDKHILRNGDQTEDISPAHLRMLKACVSLHPGENLVKFQKELRFSNATRQDSYNVLMFVTNFRLVFLEESSNAEKMSVDFPLNSIGQIIKIGRQTRTTFRDSSVYGLEIRCKDFRRFFLSIDRENHQRRDLFEFFNPLLFPFSINKIDFDDPDDFFQKFFASSYKRAIFPEQIDSGWNIYDRINDYYRMGLKEYPNFYWRIDKDINRNFTVCDTYPEVLVVPSNFSRDRFQDVIAFRSRNRFPVLSWYSAESSASITRSSQPLTGLNRKSQDDLDYLQEIGNSCVKGSKRLFIVDARPKVNAIANKASGGGYEDYPECDFEFQNIENIHVMRESLNKIAACIEKKKAISENDQASWLSHIRVILTSIMQIVQLVHVDHRCVLIHCSDGWDRTAQLTSLSMLLLDGYYRTLNGFLVLIEKEWISFGHKFLLRLGHGEKSSSEQSPIFLQFLDCTFQLMEQFSDQFEFNENLLLTITDALYTCQYGTFLLNSEKQRRDFNVSRRTVSLWTEIINHRASFINSKYKKSSENRVLFENISSFEVKLWNHFFHRHQNDARKVSSISSNYQLVIKNLQQKFSKSSNEDIASCPTTPQTVASNLSGSIEKNQMKNPFLPPSKTVG